jgi:hypothetical protein
MDGYLMKEISLNRGEDNFIESFSPENRYGVVFEDDGDTAYFYAVEKDASGGGQRILDALHIYEAHEDPEAEKNKDTNANKDEMPSKLMIVWSRDWLKCALVIDGYCHAIFDFEGQRGLNINEFPPPNSFWTKGERALTEETIREFFP